MALQPNTLFYGDNLEVLRDHFLDESIDLIYLDPPFNSQRPYNILFRERSGQESRAQVEAFNDMWTWNSIRPEVMLQHIAHESPPVSRLVNGLLDAVGETPLMAYVVMMSARLIELHRVLKPTGSLYLHCDPNASHYLKVVLDTIFGAEDFRTELVWKRSSAHSDTRQGRKQHGRIHDIILFYSKSKDWKWNPVYLPYDTSYVETFYRHIEPETGRRYRLSDLSAAKPGGDVQYEWRVKAPKGTLDWSADLDNEYKTPNPDYDYRGIPPYKGRYWAYSKNNLAKFEKANRLYYSKNGMPAYKRYLDEMPGVPLQDIWDDLPPIGPTSGERLGYPTQKPLGLLERIIQSSSDPGDIVLDPFCGCGTAVAAAQKLGRQWFGIDITHLAIAVQEQRLKDMFPGIRFHVEGVPKDVESARAMAERDFNGRAEFQYWAVSLVGGYPFGSTDGKKGKKGKDRGIDGYYTFYDEPDGRKGKGVVIQVKSGKVKSGDIRDLRGTMEREGAMIGLFITLEPPTSEMKLDAYRAGEYYSPGWNQKYPRIQILTIEELLNGAKPQVPARALPHKQAERVGPNATQRRLDMPVE